MEFNLLTTSLPHILALEILALCVFITMGEANQKLMKIIKFIFGISFIFLLVIVSDALLKTQLLTIEVVENYVNTMFFVICGLWGILVLKEWY
ncbi:hypothetical protein [Phascolarctobacterium sp.]